MKRIPLSQHRFAIVDDEDFERVNKIKWYCRNYRHTCYAIHTLNKTKTAFRMHRFIMDVSDPKIYIDHINRNGLDNRKKNLRTSNHKQNSRNRAIQIKNTSGYRGVYKAKNTTSKIWKAQIQDLDGKRLGLGYFETPEEASKVYDMAAIKIYGEFYGKLNMDMYNPNK